MIELTAVLSIASGALAGSASGHDFWGVAGLSLGAVYGFAIGLGMGYLLYEMDRLTLSWSRTNRGAIFSVALSCAMGIVGPVLSAATALAFTLVIDQFI